MQLNVGKVVLDTQGKINMHRVSSIDPTIFRTYDIRGIVDETLTEEDVYRLGQALGSSVLENNESKMVVGCDGRLSSPRLSQVLCAGILASGCDAVDIGRVPTPLLYFATHALRMPSGVMLTGSHNPAEYNGLKMVIAGKTLSESEIQDLYRRVIQQQFKQGNGERDEVDIVERYLSYVNQNVNIHRSLSIVIDAGNGVAGAVAPLLYRQLGCEVKELYCEVDGRFPHHHPDPSEPANLVDLVKKVQEVGADIGLAFDGDGDRLGVVTATGDIIYADRLMMLLSKAVITDHPKAKIIYDIKCSAHLGHWIKQCGGEPIMWKTGHSLIKAKLLETQALLAGEMSGHIFFKDRWFGFDDAIYAGARLLEILSLHSGNINELFLALPNSVNTSELKIKVAENEKNALMQAIIKQANFSNAEVVTLDGLRINFENGWGLVRPSNTTPCLVLRFEADNESVMAKIQQLFRTLLLSVNPQWVLPF
jgi:phosphomannomutase / phosphoglucomutase